MALLQNKTYIKISAISINYTRGTAEVTAHYYPTQEMREAEKLQLAKIAEFTIKAYKSVMDLHSQVEAAKASAGVTAENAAEVLSNDEKLISLIDKFNKIYKEYGALRSVLGNHYIQKENLKYLSLWQSLGLTDELCKPLPSYDKCMLSIEVPESTDLSTIYPILKKTLPNSIDC